jgi:predicted dehydrogenase
LHLFSEALAIELSENEIMVDVGKGRPVRHTDEDPVIAEDRDFINAVAGMENVIRVPYREALQTHRLTIAATLATKEGREITLQELEQHV